MVSLNYLNSYYWCAIGVETGVHPGVFFLYGDVDRSGTDEVSAVNADAAWYEGGTFVRGCVQLTESGYFFGSGGVCLRLSSDGSEIAADFTACAGMTSAARQYFIGGMIDWFISE